MKVYQSVVVGAMMVVASAAAEPTFSMGTLVQCAESTSCLWASGDGRLVDAHEMRELMLLKYASGSATTAIKSARRNLQKHMNYIEDVFSYAQSLGHSFYHRMGVSERHLSDNSDRSTIPQAFVHREISAGSTRRLAQAASSATSGSSGSSASSSVNYAASLNWCSTNNPQGRSVCSSVKSQEKCGSCWAFAAADAIETAVAITANQTRAIALSPQQLLSCSDADTLQTFEYCWASDGARGASWLDKSVPWKSTNNGCNGGMTHGAFSDAVKYNLGLLPSIEMPYEDSDGNTTTACIRSSDKSVASITGWEQVVGMDCSQSNDANVLLKIALQKQPIAVAINSDGTFKDYKGGYYSCPNDGVLASKDDVNHALVLVGYGTDSSVGDYWILKNSYGGSWGDGGFLNLVADSKVNCGLNIFPVAPTGASASLATVTVDGGGAEKYLGLSGTGWIVLAVVVSAATLVATVVGVFFARNRMQAVRAQATGAAEYQRYTQAYA